MSRKTRRRMHLLCSMQMFRIFLCALTLITLHGLVPSVHGCLKSSIYYRTRVRSRSHVFAPGEYQPRQWEHTADASGPLDARDFQHSVPTKRLVRVNSPHIVFDSEEARWMTKGCRDRLLKLSTQIQNTWAKQDVILRVSRAWIQPPAHYKPTSHADQTESQATADDDEEHDSAAESLLYHQQQPDVSSNAGGGEVGRAPTHHTIADNSRDNIFGPASVPLDPGSPIIDMTPEMLVVDEKRPSNPDTPRIHPPKQTTVVRSFTGTSRYDYLTSRFTGGQPAPSWQSSKPYRHTSSRDSINIGSDRSERMYVQQTPLRYYPMHRDSNDPGSSYRNPSATKMMRLPRHASSRSSANNETRNSMSNTTSTNFNLSSNVTRFSRKVGRSVYSLPIPIDTGYRSVNTMSQLAFEQWLQMRMEEFHYAGRAVDVQLTSRTGYTNLRDPQFSLGVLAQIAYYVAQFDWCYFSRSGHVHCSVKPDASITSQWFGCFPGSVRIRLANGRSIPIDQLQIGDNVASKNLDTGQLESTPVVAFLHRDEHAWSPMIRVTYAVRGAEFPWNGTLYLTPDHLIYVKQRTTARAESVFASDLTRGDSIYIERSNQLAAEGIVLSVDYSASMHTDNRSGTELIGLYAPLTETGSVIVDDVVVSCFAHFRHPRLSYFATWPIQLMYRISDWLAVLGLQQNKEWRGIHWFAELLTQWLTPILPRTAFYLQT